MSNDRATNLKTAVGAASPAPLARAPLRIVLVVPGGVSQDESRYVIPSIAWLVERLAQRHTVNVLALYQHADRRSYPWRGATVHTLGARSVGQATPIVKRLAPPGLDLVRSLVHARQTVIGAGGADVVHGIWGSASGLLAVLLGHLVGAPSVVSLYGGELVGLREVGYGAQRLRREKWQVARTLRMADHLTAPTDFMRRLAAEHGAEVDIVPLGVEPRALGDGAPPPDCPPWRLLYVGNLNRVKDPFTLLEAVSLLRARGLDVRLELAGGDHLDGAAQDFAGRLGLADHVDFLGHVDHGDLGAVYRRAHLLVIPSRHEAGPVVALEAAVLGVPIIGSAVGHVADWAPEAATAVQPGDPAVLADAIARLLADPARRAETAAAARRLALDHDAEWTAEAFEAVYRRLIG